MGVAKMKYLNVYGPETVLMNTLFAIARAGTFAPESGEAIHSAIHIGTNRIEPVLTKAKGLLKDLGYSSLAQEYTGPTGVYKLDEVAAYIEKYAVEVARRNQRKIAIESELEVQVKTEGLLSHMTDLDISMDELFQVETLKLRIGRLPKNSYVRLAYYAEKGFNFTSYFNFIVYDFDGEYYWGLYFAPRDSAKDIDDIFNSLYFERVWVPDFVQGKPEEALETIRQREAELRRELAEITTPAGIASEEELARIQEMTAWLATVNQLYDMRKYALVFNHTFYISGFVPADDYPAFEALIESIDTVHIKEAEQKQELPEKPPVKLKNNWFSRPYQMFTEMYGLPTYGEIDPTALVSIIYSVLYGVMFADIGQGLALGLVGYFFMYKKKHLAIGRILTRAAIFSVIFGVLFGSFFGIEGVGEGLWHSMGIDFLPFHVMGASNITLILLLAIGIGVLIMTVSMVINILTRFRRGMKGEAIFSPNGIAGLVFYLALVFLVADGMLFGTGLSGGWWYVPFLVVIPAVMMFLQEPLSQLVNEGKVHLHNGVGDMLLSSFFELFVTVLEYLSNTVSFLRVGGFILVHAGMMTVVMTLAGMASGPVYYIILVIGNIFVIALEGLLVGIQALRLNYYEVFSRFYDAGGIPFTPLRIIPDAVEL
ncbi:MAG: hypothetical protein GXY32_01745 [Ruminococcaceae bacterium]|nr:hypothetical protein [Oscillospiraceae bacterium]